MRRWQKWLAPVAFIILAGLAAGYYWFVYPATSPFHAKLPARVTDADIAEAQGTSQGVIGIDLTRKEFTGASLSAMYRLTFDMQTRWPRADRLPAGFDPTRALEAGKDPGLGIGALHQTGLTGKGVSVAVFDKPIRKTHQEFAGRITYIEVFPGHERNGRLHFHGAATASILAGKGVGVAPGASLYYFAVPDNGQNMANYATAMEQVLALNGTLPPANRIRIVSVSDGFGRDQTGDPEIARWIEMIKKAEAEGIAVVHNGSNFPFRYAVAGAEPGRDRNDPESYAPWLRIQRINGRMPADAILLPGDYRTVAANDSDTAYAYWGEGGISWGIPYMAGLLALGVQADPSATPQDLLSALTQTAAVNRAGLRLVNPQAFLARMAE